MWRVLAGDLFTAIGPAQAPAPTGASQLIPMGTTKGLQYGRLVIRNGMMIGGRGTPAEGPVDIVIDHDRIVDIVPGKGTIRSG